MAEKVKKSTAGKKGEDAEKAKPEKAASPKPKAKAKAKAVAKATAKAKAKAKAKATAKAKAKASGKRKIEAEPEEEESDKKKKKAAKKRRESGSSISSDGLLLDSLVRKMKDNILNYINLFDGRVYKPTLKSEMKEKAGAGALSQRVLNVYWTRCSCGVTCRAASKDIAHFFFHSEGASFMQRMCAALKAGQLFVS